MLTKYLNAVCMYFQVHYIIAIIIIIAVFIVCKQGNKSSLVNYSTPV